MNNPYFTSDTPITSAEQVLFDYEDYANNLYNTLQSVPLDNGFIFFLNGEWGSGKTSLINLVKEINQEKLLFNTIDFTPWIYNDEEKLISAFFEQLINNIKMQNTERSFIELLETYSELLSNIGENFPKFNYILRCLFSFLRINKRQTVTIQEQKNKLIDYFENDYIDEPILIFIDDLDRLDNEEIIKILKLIKEIAGFPNIIYFLSADKKHLINAINNHFNISNGDMYIKKFVNLEWCLPIKENTQCKDFLMNLINKNIKLNSFFKTDISGKGYTEGDYLNEMYDTCITPFLHNFRDIKLLFNSTNIRYQKLNERINYTDLLVITCINLFDYQFYAFIKKYQKYLFSFWFPAGVTPIEQKKDEAAKPKKIDDLESALTIEGFNDQLHIDILDKLFPGHNSELMYSKANQRHLISDRQSFDLYFKF